MSPKLTFDSVVWMPFAIAISLAVAFGCVAAYALVKRVTLSKGVRAVLAALRVVALLMVVILLLRPVWLIEQTLREKLGLILLADASQSMSIRDGPDGATRLDVAKKTLKSNAAQRAAIAKKYDFREFRFGRDLSELSLGDYGSDAQWTAIGDALVGSLEKMTVGNVAGVVLLSDGANNYGRDPEVAARELGARKVPIYPVVIGKKDLGEAVKDVKVTLLGVSSVAFTRNNVPVTADVSFVYCDKERVRMSLLIEEKEVATQEVSVRGQDAKARVEFMFVPDAVGPQRITVKAEPVEGELVTTNNSMTTYVHVLAGGLKVLYIGRPAQEFPFIRRALQSSKDIQPTTKSTLGEKITEPRTAAEWKQYDAVIVGDVPSSVFTSGQLNALSAAVSRNGVGFGMIAGTRNFSAGNYAGTAIADVLPVTLSSGDPEKSFEAEYRPLLTRGGEAHFMLRLEGDRDANKAAWSELKPLLGGIRLGEPKAASEVLAIGPDNEPILVVGRYGKGRTLALASDSTWRWARAEKNTVKYHDRFWRQVALWLGSKEGLGRANVWISLQSLRVMRGEPIEIVVNVQNSVGEQIPDAKIQAQITPPEGQAAPLRFTFQDDHYVSTYRPEAIADFSVGAKAFGPDGSLLGEDAAKFIAYTPEVELDNPAANPDGLSRLAAASGGKVYTVDDASELFEDLAKRDSTIEIKRTEPQPLWGTRWILYTFLAVLALEWIIRKVNRLV